MPGGDAMQWSNPEFEEAIDAIVRDDARYDRDAYRFVREALFFTAKRLEKPSSGPGRHVTAAELLDGIRLYALQEMGPVAKLVLNTWGIRSTADFGEIVYNLIARRQLGQSESDRREDFSDGFDFERAFVKPFLPRSLRSRSAKTARRGRRRSRSSLKQE